MKPWAEMTRLYALLWLSLPALALAQTGPAGPTPQIPRLDDTIVVSSVIHPDTSVLWGRAVGTVDAPLAEVVRTVEDYAGYYTFLPHFRTSKVLSQRGNSAIVYMEAGVAMDTITLWAQVKLGPLPNSGDTRVFEAKMMKGNMKILEARWELTPIDATHTSVAFQLLMDPKVPLPSSILSNENAKASRRAIMALRKIVALPRTQRPTQ